MHTTTKAIRDLLGEGYEQCESPSLRLEKYLYLDAMHDTRRTQEISQVVSCCKKHGKLPPQDRLFPGAITLVARLEANLIINQAGGILENAGMCLDPWRGYPFIPGSAIKGVAHHAAWQEWRETQDPDLPQRIARVFGYPTQYKDVDDAIKAAWPGVSDTFSGAVSFLAATPLSIKNNTGKDSNDKIGTDICTSHHPGYYQGRQEPFDNENPIPLVFPVVCSGVFFIFQIVPLTFATETACQDARRWLLKAICESGIGAKTAAGYGWFSFDEQTSEQTLQILTEELRKTQIAKQEREREERARKAKQQADELAAKQRDALKKRLATMTTEEILDEKIDQMTQEQFLTRLGQFILTGKKAIPPEEKAAILRAMKGPRHEIWLDVITLKKGKNTPNWPQIVDAVRFLHKQLYNGEKMS